MIIQRQSIVGESNFQSMIAHPGKLMGKLRLSVSIRRQVHLLLIDQLLIDVQLQVDRILVQKTKIMQRDTQTHRLVQRGKYGPAVEIDDGKIRFLRYSDIFENQRRFF